MTRAVDPFEEFLRKKSVEDKANPKRGDAEAGQPAQPALAEEWSPPDPHADPEADQRVKEEMTEFFEEGADAGAELFVNATEIDEERVDEIKDALEDVFDTEQAEPEVVDESDDTFIDFFKQVSTSFDPDLVNLRQRQQDLAREVIEPPQAGAFEDEPLTAEFPAPEEMADPEIASEPEPAPMPIGSKQPFAPDPSELDLTAMMSAPEEAVAPAEEPPAAVAPAVEVEEPEFADVSEAIHDEPVVLKEVESSPNSVENLNLAEILTSTDGADDLRQRVEVLSRLVVKLVERSQLPESDIIEVLIKSGVGF